MPPFKLTIKETIAHAEKKKSIILRPEAEEARLKDNTAPFLAADKGIICIQPSSLSADRGSRPTRRQSPVQTELINSRMQLLKKVGDECRAKASK